MAQVPDSVLRALSRAISAELARVPLAYEALAGEEIPEPFVVLSVRACKSGPPLVPNGSGWRPVDRQGFAAHSYLSQLFAPLGLPVYESINSRQCARSTQSYKQIQNVTRFLRCGALSTSYSIKRYKQARQD